MQTERNLSGQWPQVVAARLSLESAQLDALLAQDDNFREACMDYVECAAAVLAASSQSPADLVRIQEYRSLERELISDLHSLLRKLA